MICKFCGHEMYNDKATYHLCFHCGTQVSYNSYTGTVEWEKERLKVKVKEPIKEMKK